MLRSREGNWHYRFKYKGREYTGNTGLVANERERRNAEKVAKAAKAAVIASRLVPAECPDKPFVDGAAEFVRWAETVEYRSKPGTWQRIRVSFVSLCVHFQTEYVSAIGASEIEGYKDWRLNTTRVKEITLRHDLHALSGSSSTPKSRSGSQSFIIPFVKCRFHPIRTPLESMF